MHVLECEVSSRTANGTRYTVRYTNPAIKNANLLLHSARDPLTDGSRELLKMGCRGKVGLRWKGAKTVAMIGDIETLAELAITDGSKAGPRWAKWVPFEAVEVQAAE